MTAPINSDLLQPLLRDFQDDETGGRHAIRGFSFQVWWAVLEAIRCHATPDDYAIVLEWQQDVAVLNSSTNPDAVRFVQLKKNESSLTWSLTSLIGPDDSTAKKPVSKSTAKKQKAENKEKEEKPKLSILAKLYNHRRRFNLCSKSELNFISNAPFLLRVLPEEKEQPIEHILLCDLPAEIKSRIENELRKQLKLDASEIISLDDFMLQATPWPLDDSYKYVTGELAELDLLGKFGTPINAPLRAVILIANYVQQRAGKRSYAKDFDALLARAVTRQDVDSYLVAANNAHVTTGDLVQEMVERLNSEAAHFGLVREMKAEKNRACMDITNRTSPVWSVIRSLVEIYNEYDQYENEGRARDVFSSWLTEFKARKIPTAHLFKDGYLYCLMAMIIQDAKPIQQLQLIPTDPKPKDEK